MAHQASSVLFPNHHLLLREIPHKPGLITEDIFVLATAVWSLIDCTRPDLRFCHLPQQCFACLLSGLSVGRYNRHCYSRFSTEHKIIHQEANDGCHCQHDKSENIASRRIPNQAEYEWREKTS